LDVKNKNISFFSPISGIVSIHGWGTKKGKKQGFS
jgi:hypothetical protein